MPPFYERARGRARTCAGCVKASWLKPCSRPRTAFQPLGSWWIRLQERFIRCVGTERRKASGVPGSKHPAGAGTGAVDADRQPGPAAARMPASASCHRRPPVGTARDAWSALAAKDVQPVAGQATGPEVRALAWRQAVCSPARPCAWRQQQQQQQRRCLAGLSAWPRAPQARPRGLEQGQQRAPPSSRRCPAPAPPHRPGRRAPLRAQARPC